MRTVKAEANRFRVWRAIKKWMDDTGECPFATDIAGELGMFPSAISTIMKGLRERGSPGLPFPISSTRTLMNMGNIKRWSDYPGYLVPLDEYYSDDPSR